MATDSIASSVLSGMGRGTGVDFIKLARDLTDAEKAPSEGRIKDAITSSEAKISGFAILKYNTERLIEQFNGLNDEAELAMPTASSSDESKVTILSTDGSAPEGLSTLSVSSLAQGQRNLSNAFSSATQSLNSGSGFTLTFRKDDGTAYDLTIENGFDTPQGIVDKLNWEGEELGVTASLISENSSGNSFRIMVEGEVGASNGFSFTSDLLDADLGFHDSDNGNLTNDNGGASLQAATDSSFTFNGLSITRSSNTISDLVPGLIVNLKGTHASNESTAVTVVHDKTTLKNKLVNLVSAYNDVQFALNELADPYSSEPDVGGALSNDLSAVRSVRDSVFKAITKNSTTPSGDVRALRDVGITLTASGDLKFSEADYDNLASTNFSDIKVMLSGGTTDQSKYDGRPQGFARDSMTQLEVLTDSISGIFAKRTQTVQNDLRRYQSELEELDVRYEKIYDRYLAQFTVMESIVNQLNSTRTSLADTWENMGKFDK